MTTYSELSEERKEQMRAAHKRWAKQNPRTSYYKGYDANRSIAYKLKRSARQRALDNNIPWNITEKDIQVPVNCPICEQEMACSNQRGGHASSPTLDKVKPELGYIKGNIAVICKLCNSIKSSGSADLHRKIADYIESF